MKKGWQSTSDKPFLSKIKLWGLFSANDLLPFGVRVLLGERGLVAKRTSGLSGTIFEGQQRQALSSFCRTEFQSSF